MAKASVANNIYGEESVAKIVEHMMKMMAETEGLMIKWAKTNEMLKETQGELTRSRETAAELETEVTTLQFDMVSEIIATEEARTEAAELRKALGEKEFLVKHLEEEVEMLKKVNMESELKETQGELTRSRETAAELEKEVTMLRFDMLCEIIYTKEARREAAELRKILEEKEYLVKRLELEVEMLNNENMESEVKETDLERKSGGAVPLFAFAPHQYFPTKN